MSANLGVAVLAGIASTLLYLSSLTGTPVGILLAFAAPLPLFLVGLGWSTAVAALAAAIGTLALGAIGGVAVGLLFLLTTAAPPVWLSRLALMSRFKDGPATGHNGGQGQAGAAEWYPPGRLLTWLAALGVIALTGAIIAAAGQPGGLPGFIESQIDAAFPPDGPMRRQLAVNLSEEAWAELKHGAALATPAASVVFWQLSMVASALAAQKLLVLTGRALRPDFAVGTLALPRVLAILLFAMIGLTALKGGLGFWAGSAAAVFFVPYFFLGLSVVHAIPARGLGRVLFLAFFYFFLLPWGWPILLVGALGGVEQFTGIRARVQALTGRQENE